MAVVNASGLGTAQCGSKKERNGKMKEGRVGRVQGHLHGGLLHFDFSIPDIYIGFI